MEPCAVSSGVNDSYVCASPGANVSVRPAAPGPFTSVARPVASTKTQWRVSSCTCRVPTFLNCARRPTGVSPRPRALRGGARVRAHLDLVRPPVGAPAVPLVVALSVDLQRAHRSHSRAPPPGRGFCLRRRGARRRGAPGFHWT